jgi:hypothetical protein
MSPTLKYVDGRNSEVEGNDEEEAQEVKVGRKKRTPKRWAKERSNMFSAHREVLEV